jgi:hypothetical protein
MVAKIDVDRSLPTAWPFGVLKTIQWVSSLAILITLYLGPFIYGSVGFVLFSAWNAFVWALISWIAHLFGLQRKVFHFGNGFVYFPFAAVDFALSLVFLLLFAVSTLICIVAAFDGIRYRPSVIITYLFATIFSAIACASFAYFAILLKRGLPNGNWRNFMTMIVEGDRLSSRGEINATQAGPGAPSATSTRHTYPGY